MKKYSMFHTGMHRTNQMAFRRICLWCFRVHNSLLSEFSAPFRAVLSGICTVSSRGHFICHGSQNLCRKTGRRTILAVPASLPGSFMRRFPPGPIPLGRTMYLFSVSALSRVAPEFWAADAFPFVRNFRSQGYLENPWQADTMQRPSKNQGLIHLW